MIYRLHITEKKTVILFCLQHKLKCGKNFTKMFEESLKKFYSENLFEPLLTLAHRILYNTQ